MSIQPADDGGPVGWGIATFVDHGPSAQATARGSVTVDVSVPAEEESGEGEGGVAPVTRQLTVGLGQVPGVSRSSWEHHWGLHIWI